MRNPNPRHIDTRTAALAAGVTDRTIRRWVTAGTLTNVGSPAAVLVDIEELRRVISDMA